MNTRLPLLLAFATGALCGVVAGWPARGQRAATESAAPPAHAAPPVAAASAPVLTDARGDDAFDGAQPHRNPFAFLEPPPRPVKHDPVVPLRSIATVPLTPAEPPRLDEPPPIPAFPYRFIGSFGSRDTLLAAFAGEGEVINVRPGGTIGNQFRLARINAGDVELSWNDRPLRVPLTR